MRFAPDTLVIFYELFTFSTSLLIHVLAEQCRADSAIPNMRHICIVKPFLGENANMKDVCWSPGFERNSTVIMGRD